MLGGALLQREVAKGRAEERQGASVWCHDTAIRRDGTGESGDGTSLFPSPIEQACGKKMGISVYQTKFAKLSTKKYLWMNRLVMGS
jgi:hypothetical protein